MKAKTLLAAYLAATTMLASLSSFAHNDTNQNDDLKHAIALEILIELAEHGGRVLDEDNTTVLENNRAVKKVMNALKDKAREMKKKGGEETGSTPAQAASSDTFVPDTRSSLSLSSDSARLPAAGHHRHEGNHGSSTLHSDAIEPEAFVEGETSPAEGEALECFSSYWLRRRG